MRICAVMCVRNEAAFLLDWLAHHQACGITDFVVMSNDCDDGTDTVLDRLQAMGIVHHIRNDGPYGKQGIQFAGLKRADDHPAVQNADWLLALDIDEYVNVHVGDRTLPALTRALPDATAITLTWRLFGNAGLRDYTDTPLRETFTRAAPAIINWPWRATMFKTLYRNDANYARLGVHRPRAFDKSRAPRWFDGEGRLLGPEFTDKRIFSNYGQSNTALAQLNHYPLGSMQGYILKSARGRAVHSDDSLGMDYWCERNYACATDNTITALPCDTQRAALAADPQLAALHAAAVAWRHAEFDRLMLHDGPRALYARLLMTPPSRSLTSDEALLLRRYAQTAQNQMTHTP